MKKIAKIIFYVVLLMGCTTPLFSQIKFRKKIGGNGYDYGMSAIQIEEKGYIICGSTSSYGYGNSDIFIVKTDSLGTPGVHTTFGGINIDRGTCIRKTTDNGYIISGYTNSFSTGGYDVYVIKVDSLLNQQWAKSLGGDDWDFANCVEQTSDGGFIICGSTYSFGNGNEDYYVVKTNSLGDTTWTKTYGGANQDVAKSVIETSDGGFLITGFTKSFGDVQGDIYSVKIDINGDTLWTNKIGGLQADSGFDVIESSAGYYIVCGETKSIGAGDADGVIYRISYSGVTGINYTFGGASFDSFQSITEKANGHIAMTGKTTSFGFANGNGEVLIVALKQDWSFVNATTFGGYEKEDAFSVEPTEDNAYIICGQTNDTYNVLEDIYLIKTDSTAASTTIDVSNPTTIFENTTKTATIKLYPNPANSQIIIDLKDIKEDATIVITNSIGQVVKRATLSGMNNSTVVVPTSTLASGIYFLSVYATGYRIIGTEKVSIQH